MRELVEKKEPERTNIDVEEFARACIDLVEMGQGGKRSIISYTVEPDLPFLPADPVQIRQVLVNLLRNAREAVSDSETQEVHLFVVGTDGFIEFRVRDTGPGVPEEVVPELFRAFSGKKQKGLGLGLAISRSIAQNHGGDLFLDTNAIKPGATFVLKLPTGKPVYSESES
ncbi:HAMP domain-containing sensor histidine kinase [uncultured Roseibium sp.]|uniref:sensor histidine kinase n=1 Tax=uncultured Roseibium sp. TaxID=1936171 RepID=UPI003216380F